jgi:hypothetical protein
MNHVTRIEIPEASSHAGRVMRGPARPASPQWEENIRKIRIRVVLNVLRQVPAQHLIRDEVEDLEWDDVWMSNALCHSGCLMEGP